MEETRVNFETASLAKDKGFDIPCDARWWIEPCSKWMESKQGAVKCNNSSEDSISRPTQALLQKWLRENHEIHVTPRESYAFDNTLEYVCTVNDIYVSHNDPKLPINRFPSWEQALEIGLQEGLKLIKEKE